MRHRLRPMVVPARTLTTASENRWRRRGRRAIMGPCWRPTGRPTSPASGDAATRGRRHDRCMTPKPILVGYDTEAADRGPVAFGAAAARFTGAHLIIGSVYADAVVVGQMAGGQMDEELATDVS